jgi:hypothetical protein
MTGSVVLTGAGGLRGWHVRVLARALMLPDPVFVRRAELADPDCLTAKLDVADRVLHLSGANRGQPDEVRESNLGAVCRGTR